MKVWLTRLAGSSRNCDPVSIIWLKPRTIRGFRPTWRRSPTGSRSSTEAGNSGNSSRRSTKQERRPLRVSQQCERARLPLHFSLFVDFLAAKVALWATRRMWTWRTRLWIICGRRRETRTSFTSSPVSRPITRRGGCSGPTCSRTMIRYEGGCIDSRLPGG